MNVSPFERELLSKLIFIKLWPKFFAANSKLIVVLVEGSKNKLKIFLGFLLNLIFWNFEIL
jgi:RAB protein geranylgeranyltransferase component A